MDLENQEKEKNITKMANCSMMESTQKVGNMEKENGIMKMAN